MRRGSSSGLLLVCVVAPLASAHAVETPPSEVVASEAAAPSKPWSASLGLRYGRLLVTDDTSGGDQSLAYRLGGRAEVFPGGKVSIRLGLNERFVAQPEESGFRLTDTTLSLSYGQTLPVGPKSIDVSHELAFALPTSRASSRQDLYVAVGYTLSLSMDLVSGLTASVSPNARYRAHAFAERAGMAGVMNTQWEFGSHLGLDYTLLDLGDELGNLTLGASGGWTWFRQYDAVDQHASVYADSGAWNQGYDYEAHVAYVFLERYSLTTSIEQGSNVLRDGIVNVSWFNRDEVELALAFGARF